MRAAHVILAYSGRRASSLPEGGEDVVATRVERLLGALAPAAVVGAAADGGDLIVLEAALARPDPPEVHIVLPTSAAQFRVASVQDSWRIRHDRVLERVAQLGGHVESLELPDGEDAYRKANARVLGRASSLAHTSPVLESPALEEGRAERVVALVIAAPGEGELVNDFIARAELCGIEVLRIDPTVNLK